MQLSGRLRLTTLGDLLGTILREGLSGTLELTEERGPGSGRIHRLYLHAGHVVQIETEQNVRPLGELIVAAGWLNHSQLAVAVERSRASGKALGQWLVNSGTVPQQALVDAVVEQLRLRLEALFRVEDARVAFRVVQTRRRELDSPRLIAPREYLLGRPRARDRAVASQKPSRDAVGYSADARRDLMTLGLDLNANEQAIRTAFRRLARALHPDMHPSASPNQRDVLRRRFAAVSSAYHRLADQFSVTKIAI